MGNALSVGTTGLSVLLACVLGTGGLAGQAASGAVTGRVVHMDGGVPVSAAEVVLRRVADSTAVARAHASFDGRFRVAGVRVGKYVLEISSLGHGTRTTEPFEVEVGIIYDFGRVEMSVEALTLDPIHLVVAREGVSRGLDRTSYLLAGLSAAQGGSIADALRALPGLYVDFDGNLEIRGERPALWINGRPAPIAGEALVQFFEQFPTALVDRIEVIDHPSSALDAEGTGGIVNIVLHEGTDLGFSGSVFTNVDSGGSTGAGGQGTLQRGDWVWDGSLSVRRRDSETEAFNLRQNLRAEPTEFIERGTWNASETLAGDLSLRTTYSPGDRARLWIRANHSGHDREQEGIITTTHMGEARNPFLRFGRTNRSDGAARSLDLRTGFEWRWEPRRHFADLELRITRRTDRGERREEIEADADLDHVDLLPAELTLHDREDSERELRLDLRYRRPMGDRASLSTGYSLLNQSTSNEQTFTDLGSAEHPEGQTTIHGFGRTQTLNAAYVTLDQAVADQVVIQGGLRAEHVDWRLDFHTGRPVRGHYLDAFPSVNLSWNLSGARRVRLSYSRRLARPPVSVLDPTDRSTDPLERVAGNPAIQPSYTHRVQLDASWPGGLGTISVVPYLSRSANGWERIVTLDDEGISTRTWDNVSSESTAGLSVGYSFQDLRGWQGSANLTGGRTHRNAGDLSQRFSGSRTDWSALLNLDGQIHGGLTGQASLRYRAAVRTIQGRNGSQASADISFRQRLMENRLSVHLVLRDPFAVRRSAREVRDADVWEVHRSTGNAREAQLSVTYALGRRWGGGR